MKLSHVILLLLVPIGLLAQSFNRLIPEGFPPYEFRVNSPKDIGYYAVCPYSLERGDTLKKAMALLDNYGYIAWYTMDTAMYFHNLEYVPEHQLFSYVTMSNGINFKCALLDTGFNEVDHVPAAFGYLPDMHEFQVLKNGNLLVIDKLDSTIDLSAYTFLDTVPGSSKTSCRGFNFKEIDDKTKQVLLEWRALDYIHPTECYDLTWGYSEKSFDCMHGNAVDEGIDGHFLVSLRNINAIIKVHRKTGKVIWRLGGKKSDFKLLPGAEFNSQHDVRQRSNGNITVFDNKDIKSPKPNYSRALEIKLDTVNMTATKAWSYEYKPKFFVSARGSHHTTKSGYRQINYGTSFRPNPNMVILDPSDSIMAAMFYRDSIINYRTRIVESFQLKRPEIICNKTGNKLTLTAPSGYEKYLWSTRETTTSITVSDTGTYQVWVNKGIGMVGSYPYFVNGSQVQCEVKKLEIVGVYDQLGRIVLEPETYKIYIVRYVNGTSALVWWNEAMQQWFEKNR